VNTASPTKQDENGSVFLDHTGEVLEKAQHEFPADFVKVDGIYLPAKPTDGGFDYTDGDAEENYMHEAIRSARDCSSSSFELERYIKDWPSEYHFSRHRTNLLRPFPLQRYQRVLEIGAGCGAITRTGLCPPYGVPAVMNLDDLAAATQSCRLIRVWLSVGWSIP
jgi:hypothetical protein